MKLKYWTTLKICGLCGIISTIIFFIFIGLAIWLSPWFSWTDHFISDIAGSLGDTPIWAGRGLASIFLNSGLILAGFIGIIFTGLIKKTRLFHSNLGKIGIFVLFIDMSAICGVGVFPVTLGNIHYVFSIILFCLIPIFLYIIAHEIGEIFGKKWWLILNIILVISLIPACILIFVPELVGLTKAIGEIVMLFSFYLTVIILGIKLIKTTSTEKLKDSFKKAI